MEKKQKRRLVALSAIGVTAVASYYTIKKITHHFFEIAFNKKEADVRDEYYDYFDKREIRQLTLENRDGLKLNGYYLPKEDAKFTAILIHGYHGSAFTMKNYVEAFSNNFNCNIFLPDLQSHGESQGDYVGFGCLDAKDMEEWIDFLNAMDNNLPIVAFGLSMGAATVCQLSDKEIDSIVCYVEDCGFDTLYNQFNHRLLKDYKLVLKPLAGSLSRLMKKRTGYTLKQASPVESVKNARKPMMFIHGLDDDYVPSDMVFNLYNACPTEKELYYVRDAGHAEALKCDYEGYMQAVSEFINRYI